MRTRGKQWRTACGAVLLVLGVSATPAEAEEPGDSSQLWAEILWARLGKQVTEVPVPVPEEETDALAALVKKLSGQDYASDALLPRDDRRLPPTLRRYRLGQALPVITTQGVLQLKIKERRVSVLGAGDPHYCLHLDKARGAGGDGLVLPVGRQVPRTTRLVKARSEDVSSPAMQALLRRVLQQVATQLPAEQAARARQLKLSSKNFSFYRGRFKTAAGLVAIHLSDPAPAPGDDRLTGLVFVDEAGQILRAATEPWLDMYTYRVEYLVDADQDGIDEVIVDARYHEGGYTRLVKFDGEALLNVTLAGGGV